MNSLRANAPNPLKAAIIAAVKDMRGIPYFPQDDDVHVSIMTAISRFADSVDGVKWMAQKAVDHMTAWTGIPELRGIYCAGGFKPADGRFEQCSIAALIESRPPYYELASVMQKRLPEPPPDPTIEAALQTDIAELQAKIDESARQRNLNTVKSNYRREPPPAWLRNL